MRAFLSVPISPFRTQSLAKLQTLTPSEERAGQKKDNLEMTQGQQMKRILGKSSNPS